MSIVTKPVTKEYEEGWDRIFQPKQSCPVCKAPLSVHAWTYEWNKFFHVCESCDSFLQSGYETGTGKFIWRKV